MRLIEGMLALGTVLAVVGSVADILHDAPEEQNLWLAGHYKRADFG